MFLSTAINTNSLNYAGDDMSIKPKSEKTKSSFTYNMERMKTHVASATVVKPRGLKGKELTDWLMSH